MTAFYNEIGPYAAQWLRNLIAAGLIAPGVVDERSIQDIKPEELHAYTQCHFFAGIGVWSFALRAAGWPDDRRVWTGSAPCQPFSAAGAGAGFDDERHLWPDFKHLIAECNPPIVLGEQVASSHVDPWIDLVHADLEALGYAFGGIPFPSAGVGAPHIRDRLYWVGHAHHQGLEGFGSGHQAARGWVGAAGPVAEASEPVRLADAMRPRSLPGSQPGSQPGIHRRKEGAGARDGEPQRSGAACGLANADGCTRGQGRADVRGRVNGGDAQPRPGLGGSILLGGLGDTDGQPAGRHSGSAHATKAGHGAQGGDDYGPGDASVSVGSEFAGPTNGYWRDADWLGCRDGKWRPVEPGTFPLAHGATGRVGRSGADWRTAAGEEGKGHRAGRLKGYGNAINAEAARVFIEAVMESEQ